MKPHLPQEQKQSLTSIRITIQSLKNISVSAETPRQFYEHPKMKGTQLPSAISPCLI
jgi:hypothetical protein